VPRRVEQRAGERAGDDVRQAGRGEQDTRERRVATRGGDEQGERRRQPFVRGPRRAAT